MDHQAVAAASGAGQCFGSISRDPDRHFIAVGPRQLRRCVVIGDFVTAHQTAQSIGEALHIGDGHRLASQHAARAVAAADANFDAIAALQGQRGVHAAGHGPFAYARVGHQRPEYHVVGVRHAKRHRQVTIAPEHV